MTSAHAARGVQNESERIKKAASPACAASSLARPSVGGLAAISNLAGGPDFATGSAKLEDVPSAPALASFCLIALCSFASFYATRGTSMPSFVVAIALGIAGHTLFAPIVAEHHGAFGTGDRQRGHYPVQRRTEVPLGQFFRLLAKIALLALPGVLLTGFALSWTSCGALAASSGCPWCRRS